MFLVLVTNRIIGKPIDYLSRCWNKQVKPISEQYLTFHFEENLNRLEHTFEPWQQTNYMCKGIISCNVNNFIKRDTLINGFRTSFSNTELSKTDFLFVNYGEKELSPVTKGMYLDQLIKSARYSPLAIIDYFFQNKVAINKGSNEEYALYITTINNVNVTLQIRKSDYLLNKIITLSYDELFGDVLTTFIFKDYNIVENIHYSKSISIEKYNGKVKDEVKISIPKLSTNVSRILIKPSNFEFSEDIEVKPAITLEKYNDNIYFLELKHTDDRILVVEFKDFMLVAEAPLNSKNGEVIIREVKKIAPTKPIRYFVFGHYHPHYIGGIRPFVHKGAEIICSKIDEDYVRYLTDAPHTLAPDSLHSEFKQLKIKEIKDSLVIENGKIEMKIYFIGEESMHTKDYLIYYFPQEKLLFEDDLVWIEKEGSIKRAKSRQVGLYKALKRLNLDVKTIIQSWPVKDYGVKTVIPFEDLEKSMTAN